MAKAKLDPAILAHLEWLGFVRPTGLVISAPALVRAGAVLDRRDAEGQRLLRTCLDGADEHAPDRVQERVPVYGATQLESEPHLIDFRAFAHAVLGWSFSPKGYAGTAESPIPTELELPLPDYGETLRRRLSSVSRRRQRRRPMCKRGFRNAPNGWRPSSEVSRPKPRLPWRRRARCHPPGGAPTDC